MGWEFNTIPPSTCDRLVYFSDEEEEEKDHEMDRLQKTEIQHTFKEKIASISSQPNGYHIYHTHPPFNKIHEKISSLPLDKLIKYVNEVEKELQLFNSSLIEKISKTSFDEEQIKEHIKKDQLLLELLKKQQNKKYRIIIRHLY
ncbi:MAG: hypothetical protein VX777_00370 [Chlamydiota bacterium]|nr:hypothetical protein [Chlamydiota bacterium]